MWEERVWEERVWEERVWEERCGRGGVGGEGMRGEGVGGCGEGEDVKERRGMCTKMLASGQLNALTTASTCSTRVNFSLRVKLFGSLIWAAKVRFSLTVSSS